MKLLTIFNNKGNRTCFQQSIESWRDCKELDTEAIVLNDGPSNKPVSFVKYQEIKVGASGYAKHTALQLFVKSHFTHCFFFDNDLLFKSGFDSETLSIWDISRDRFPNSIASPYRSGLEGHNRPGETQNFDQFAVHRVITGPAMFMDQSMACKCLVAIPWHIFYRGWDWALSDALGGLVVPKKSFVLNIGIKDGQNELLEFDGDGFYEKS